MRRFCERRGNTNFCEPKRVLQKVSGYLWAIAGGEGGGAGEAMRRAGAHKGSANSEGVKRTCANDKTLPKQSADHFCFAVRFCLELTDTYAPLPTTSLDR